MPHDSVCPPDLFQDDLCFFLKGSFYFDLKPRTNPSIKGICVFFFFDFLFWLISHDEDLRHPDLVSRRVKAKNRDAIARLHFITKQIQDVFPGRADCPRKTLAFRSRIEQFSLTQCPTFDAH